MHAWSFGKDGPTVITVGFIPAFLDDLRREAVLWNRFHNVLLLVEEFTPKVALPRATFVTLPVRMVFAPSNLGTIPRIQHQRISSMSRRIIAGILKIDGSVVNGAFYAPIGCKAPRLNGRYLCWNETRAP